MGEEIYEKRENNNPFSKWVQKIMTINKTLYSNVALKNLGTNSSYVGEWLLI